MRRLDFGDKNNQGPRTSESCPDDRCWWLCAPLSICLHVGNIFTKRFSFLVKTQKVSGTPVRDESTEQFPRKNPERITRPWNLEE